MGQRATRIRLLVAGLAPLLVLPLQLRAQTPAAGPGDALPLTTPHLSNDRIFGIIPNFQTVSNPDEPFVALPVREKWELFIRETVDPYSFGTAAAGAALSQWRNGDPKYGQGWGPYFQRFGAAQADVATQNFFQDAVLASLLHEDPRYFREGPSRPVMHRIVYALSRVLVTKNDSGRDTFNISGIAGMGLGIALSNAYYPPKSVSWSEMESRVVTSLMATAMGNLLPEFWPDIRARLNRFRHR